MNITEEMEEYPEETFQKPELPSYCTGDPWNCTKNCKCAV